MQDKRMLRDSWRYKAPACSRLSLLSWGVAARVTEGLVSCFLMHDNLTKAGDCLAIIVQPWSAPLEWKYSVNLPIAFPLGALST